jgi:diaminopimelate epimerase
MMVSKWQGLGNDYLIVEESALPAELTAAAIELLCDRHLGLGADGILINCRPTRAFPDAVARMRVFNPDGSEPEMCGNGIRMFARYLQTCGAVDSPEFTVETLAGPVRPALRSDGGVRVDMGLARFNSGSIAPEAGRAAGLYEGPAEIVGAWLVAGEERRQFTFVDVGNPHCVLQVDDPASADVASTGALIERHCLFPNRVNVQFAKVERDGAVRMRVWERGVGETRASGTGATAVGAACIRLGLARSPVLVHLPGGDLTIEAEAAEGQGAGMRVHMTGPAEEVFRAELSADLCCRLGWPSVGQRRLGDGGCRSSKQGG